MRTLKNKIEIKKLIDLFGDAASCNIQHKGCPCNRCFRDIDNSKVDFQHIVWLILLGLRGDYESEYILKHIKLELGNKFKEVNK